MTSLIAASSVDVALTGVKPVDKRREITRGVTLDSKCLKRGYKIDTTLLGGNKRTTKSRKRKKESHKAESELKKRKTIVDALFPDETEPEYSREFHASSTNQGLCDYVEFTLRAILAKNATPESFNNAIVPYDDTAIQAMAIIVEEVARSHVELWKDDCLALLKKQGQNANVPGEGAIADKNGDSEDEAYVGGSDVEEAKEEEKSEEVEEKKSVESSESSEESSSREDDSSRKGKGPPKGWRR